MHQQQPDAGTLQPRLVQTLIGKLRVEGAVWAGSPPTERRGDYADGLALACDALELLLRDAYARAQS